MRTYDFSYDLIVIRKLLSLTQEKLSLLTNIPRITIARAEKNEHLLSDENLEKFYDFVFNENIFINRVQSELLIEKSKLPILFHGAKQTIKEDLNLEHADDYGDFGKSFYLGESYEEAADFVYKYNGSSVYAFEFDDRNLKKLEFNISTDWMIAILYFRGRLQKFKDHPIIKSLLDKIQQFDYIVAPIADNDMYQILNSFSNGEITDEQCKHALAASNLGKQIVFFKKETLSNLKDVKRFYICKSEKMHFAEQSINKKAESKLKADLAIMEYRRKGQFIDEIFK